MPIIRNGLSLVNRLQGTSQIAFVFQGTVQVWAHEIVFVLGASGAASYLVDIVNGRPGVWGSTTPKRIVVPAGVERGSGTSWVFAPMPAGSLISSSWGGSLTLEIRGTLSGIGGTANSGVGGNVIVGTVTGKDGQKLILNVFAGAILRAGGGGGGRAGNGGMGVWYSGRWVVEGPIFNDSFWTQYAWRTSYWYAGSYSLYWGSNAPITPGNVPGPYTYGPGATFNYGGWTYVCGALRTSVPNGDNNTNSYEISRQYYTVDVPNYTAGGVAGNAGRGQGFDGAATVGAAAVGGGTNAGASGKSGDGGGYGTAGATGANGSSGNYTGGLAGAAGGLAGCYLAGAANVNFTNNGGTLLGRLAA